MLRSATTAATIAVAMMMMTALTMTTASVPYSVDTLDDLYRLQQLYQISEMQRNDPYLSLLPIDDIDSRSEEAAEEGGAGSPLWGGEVGAGDDEEDSVYASPFFTGAAQARDEEHLQHSALYGLHSVSGGTIEGEPPQKQVKTDKPLPAYCNPPNPCPVGKTAADNCVENFDNSMENNKRLLATQDCPCDTEHMFSCPAGQQTVTSKGNGAAGGQAAINKVISELAHLRSDQEMGGEQAELNPFLDGKQMSVAAKKSPQFKK